MKNNRVTRRGWFIGSHFSLVVGGFVVGVIFTIAAGGALHLIGSSYADQSPGYVCNCPMIPAPPPAKPTTKKAG